MTKYPLEITKDEFVEAVCEKMDKMKALFIEKNKQYSTEDPLANFRTYAKASLGTGNMNAMFRVGKGYCGKHFAMVENSNIYNPKVQESMLDTAVYNLIFAVMADVAQKNNEIPFRPQIGTEYWYVGWDDENIGVDSTVWNGDVDDYQRLACDNCFPTEETAEDFKYNYYESLTGRKVKPDYDE